MVRFFVRSGGVIYLVQTSAMLAVSLNNFSYKYNLTLTILGTTTEFPDFVGPFTNYPVSSLTVINNTYYSDRNRIQASELDNPLYFPAKNSYRVGNGKILGMATNSIALSQGQFGQFPIFCFTSEGTWAMSIGNGDVLIETITPLNREVCNSPASITMIDGGTVFSTSKGLHIISGTTPTEISQSAEGAYQGPLAGSSVYQAAISNPNLYQITDYLCSASMLTYIQGAKIGWDYKNRELVISNPAYKYSWVYSLPFKTWFKISQSFDRIISDFPNTYGYKSISAVTTKYNLSEESFSGLITVHLETRPIKLSAGRFKKLVRAVINGFIYNNEDYPFSVNVFGSPDARSWHLLSNSSSFGSRTEMLIGKATFSCHYYIIVFGGKVDADAYFTGIQAAWDDTFNNKLR